MKQKIYAEVDEQETVITFMRNDTEVSVFTSDPTMVTKLDKLFARSKEQLSKNKLIGVEYQIPKNSIYFKASKTKQILSDEQKQNLISRLHQK